MSTRTKNKKHSQGCPDFLLTQHKLKRAVNTPALENIIKAENIGCAAYEKAVLSNKLTYLYTDGHDQFDASVSATEMEENWSEVIGNAKLTKFALDLANVYQGSWICITLQGDTEGEAHCIAMFIENLKNGGKGMMKYFKVLDKEKTDLDAYAPIVPEETTEMKVEVETKPVKPISGSDYRAKIDACTHDWDYTTNAIKCKKNCGGDKWSV